jgi:hypothetical protein
MIEYLSPIGLQWFCSETTKRVHNVYTASDVFRVLTLVSLLRDMQCSGPAVAVEELGGSGHISNSHRWAIPTPTHELGLPELATAMALDNYEATTTERNFIQERDNIASTHSTGTSKCH